MTADTLDVCTLTGEVVGLRRLSKFEYVAAHVTDRQTYVPVIVDAKRQKGVCVPVCRSSDYTRKIPNTINGVARLNSI